MMKKIYGGPKSLATPVMGVPPQLANLLKIKKSTRKKRKKRCLPQSSDM